MARTPKFSKSGFEFIASVLRQARVESLGTQGLGVESVDKLIDRFGRELMATNPRFDPQRFIQAAKKIPY